MIRTVYVVVRSGKFTQDMNGTAVTADRACVLAVRSSMREAVQVLEDPRLSGAAGWGVCATWIDTVAVDGEVRL